MRLEVEGKERGGIINRLVGEEVEGSIVTGVEEGSGKMMEGGEVVGEIGEGEIGSGKEEEEEAEMEGKADIKVEVEVDVEVEVKVGVEAMGTEEGDSGKEV